MANTQILKNEIEPALIKYFVNSANANEINVSSAEKKNIFLGMEPDVIAYDSKTKTLFIGECTTSGYLGSKLGNWHRGGAYKLSEVFSKATLICSDKFNKKIIMEVKSRFGISVEKIKCVFIVPKGAAFLKAVGFRKLYFKTGYLDLFEAEINKELKSKILCCLESSRKEMK